MLLWNDTTLLDNMFVLDNYVLTLLVYNKHKLNVLYELYETLFQLFLSPHFLSKNQAFFFSASLLSSYVHCLSVAIFQRMSTDDLCKAVKNLWASFPTSFWCERDIVRVG